MKKIIYLTLFVLSLAACNESATSTSSSTTPSNSTNSDSAGNASVTISEIEPTSTSNLRDNYSESSYSKFVLFHKNEDKVLIDYNFFPEGSDICQQATYNETSNPNGCKTDMSVVIPCQFQSEPADDLLSIGLSATENEGGDCLDAVVVDLSAAHFTVEGLEFPFQSALETFSQDFEFKIQKESVVDSLDENKLDFDSNEIGLEEITEQINSKRSI